MFPQSHDASHSHAPASFLPKRRVAVREPKRWPVKSLVAGIALLSLMGCATNRLVGGTSVYCDIARPIGWSSADDSRTIQEVKSHNAVGKELCGWR
jgi:type IV pilus biogenesis protein CpaD/CtpE